jgi:DNA-binding response OmpR family regulator
MILVVVDEERVQHFAAGALKELGYHALQATNGEAALFLKQGRGIDLLFYRRCNARDGRPGKR